MIVKMQGPGGTFTLVDGVMSASFGYNEKEGGAREHYADLSIKGDVVGQRRFFLLGRAFVLNERGDTIDSFGPQSLGQQEQGRTEK